MATATTKDATTTEVKVAKHKNVRIGPLLCRVSANEIPADPNDGARGAVTAGSGRYATVESLAKSAQQFIGAHADGSRFDDPAVRRRNLLSAKATRGGAASAVKVAHLSKPDGSAFTKAELAPLVTLVRKQLVKDLRQQHKEQDRRDREAAEAEAREAGLRKKAMADAILEARKKANVAILPERAKPTRAVSKDESRPALAYGYVQQIGDGWELVCSNSYHLTRYPLDVTNPGAIAAVTIGPVALKAIEKAGAFRVTKAGTIQPVNVARQTMPVYYPARMKRSGAAGYCELVQARDAGEAFGPPTDGVPIRVADRPPRKGSANAAAVMVMPDVPAQHRLEISFDAGYLKDLAVAMGSSLDHVTLALDLRTFDRAQDKVRRYRPRATNGDTRSVAIVVTPKAEGGARAMLMPVDPTKPITKSKK